MSSNGKFDVSLLGKRPIISGGSQSQSITIREYNKRDALEAGAPTIGLEFENVVFLEYKEAAPNGTMAYNGYYGATYKALGKVIQVADPDEFMWVEVWELDRFMARPLTAKDYMGATEAEQKDAIDSIEIAAFDIEIWVKASKEYPNLKRGGVKAAEVNVEAPTRSAKAKK